MMMKLPSHLAVAAAACLLSTGAQATVTYTLTDQNAQYIDISWQTSDPITKKTIITDFAGQKCQVGDQYVRLACTSLTIDPTYYDEEANYRAETILLSGALNGMGTNASTALTVGALATNGVHTGKYSTLVLTVTGIGSPAAQTAAVPEPATWALMLAGFGLTAAALRRRHVRFAAAVA